MKRFLLVVLVLGVLAAPVWADNYGVIIQGSSPTDGMFPEGQGIPPTYGYPYSFMDEFWNDCVICYLDWIATGIPEENIWVLWGDGSQWGMEQTGYQERYRIPFVDMDCSRKSLDSICAYLVDVLTEEDILVVFTFDHGGPNTLCLYGSIITALEFAELFDAIPYGYRAFWMQQCFSGSFIDELENERTILETSTDATHSAYRADNIEAPGEPWVEGIENEIVDGRIYNHGEFDFHWITAWSGGWKLSGDTTVCYLDSIDLNQDGKISILEQFEWVMVRDTRYYNGYEFPQLSDLGKLAERFFIWPKVYLDPTGIAEPGTSPRGIACLKVYPNPTRGLVSFEIKNPADQIELKIFDSSGRLVKESQIINRVDVELNAAGVYFYKLIQGKNTQSGKFVVLK